MEIKTQMYFLSSKTNGLYSGKWLNNDIWTKRLIQAKKFSGKIKAIKVAESIKKRGFEISLLSINLGDYKELKDEQIKSENTVKELYQQKKIKIRASF